MAKVERLISRSEMVRRSNVSKSVLYRLCDQGGRLFNAMVNGSIDLEHPDAYAFCKEFGYVEPNMQDVATAAIKKERKAAKNKTPTAPPTEFILPEIDDPESDNKTAQELMAMPLGEIVARYGKQAAFKEYVNINKVLVQTRGYEEEQARKRGEYMHWSHVEKIVGLVDALQGALLTETTANITSTVTALIKANSEKKEIERSVHNVISRTIKATKQRMIREIHK